MDVEIVKHVKALVKAKYELDFFLQGYKRQKPILKLYNQMLGLQIPPDVPNFVAVIEPRNFIWCTLPFSDKVPFEGDKKVEEIDPFLVVGATYKVYEEITKKEELRHIKRLNTLPEHNKAKYHQVGNFPLYIAIEGKNRVLTYQRNNKLIKAEIEKYEYPKAEELILYRILPYNLYGLRCLDPDFYSSPHLPNEVIILPYPKLVLPLLKLYGVKKVKTVLWPLAIYTKYLIMKEMTNSTISLGVGFTPFNMPMGVDETND